MPRKQWRCFFCDGVFKSEATARDHFGIDTEDAWKPGCIDPLTKDETERREFIVGLFLELEGERAENSELQNKAYLLAKAHNDLARLFKGAKSVQQAYLEYDAMEGRALAAEEKLAELLPKANAAAA